MQRAYAPIMILLAVPGIAAAQQWQAVVLHPPAATYSRVHGIEGTTQVGFIAMSPNDIAGLWRGSAESWTPLSAAGTNAMALSIGGGDKVGYVGSHATLWQGAAANAVDLHPGPGTGAISSSAVATAKGIQSGGIRLPFDMSHGGYWTGTPESFVSLHPAGAVQSAANATDGILQGGAVMWTNRFRAAIWSGSAASVVDLGPNLLPSHVTAMAPGVQVGWWRLTAANRAALWRGTPESFVDMTPPWANSAQLFATTGRVHAGIMPQQGLGRAAVNFGTPEAWLGLHQFLPAPYTGFSRAQAVYQDGPTIYVGGYAENMNTTYDEAILWIGTDPCYPNCDGSTIAPFLNVSDFGCFLQKFAAGDLYANCDQSTVSPVLNVADFGCFLQRFAAGCP